MQNPMLINFEEIDSYIKHEFCYEANKESFVIKEPTPNYSSINDFIKESDDILQDNIRKLGFELNFLDTYSLMHNAMFPDLEGTERGKIEYRKKWDPGMIKVLELIKE